ncbi:hypothetical protein ACIG3E_33390 [Streptomyces sp. NPDC053474]
MGRVLHVHTDVGDGVDIRLVDGRVVNIMSTGLDPAPQGWGD